jgi:hypothetical protein
MEDAVDGAIFKGRLAHRGGGVGSTRQNMWNGCSQ